MFNGRPTFSDSPELGAETKIGVLLGSLSYMALGDLALMRAPKATTLHHLASFHEGAV